MRKSNRAGFVVAAALAATAAGLLGSTAYADDVPPNPPGVGADGKVNLEKAPRDLAVVGPDGRVVTDAPGQARKWQTRFNELPPPPGQAKPDGFQHRTSKDTNGRPVETVDVPFLRP